MFARRPNRHNLGKEISNWNSIIAQNALHSPQNALTLYKHMLAQQIPPNNFTFPALLKACAALAHPVYSSQIHAHIAQLGVNADPFTAAALIHAYGKCGSPKEAQKLFDEMPQCELDIVSWTSLVSALATNGWVLEAFQSFVQMRHCVSKWGLGDGIDVLTLGVLLSACSADSNCLFPGRMVHGLVVKYGFESKIRLANSLIHMYSRCEAMDDATKVFDGTSMEQRDVVSWNIFISGLAVNGRAERAVAVFDEMISAGVMPNRVTLLAAMKACAEFGCMETCRRIHEYMNLHHNVLLSSNDVVVETALLDMLARCGSLELARCIFDGIQGKNVVCWSAMIASYEQSSYPEEALRLFRRMIDEVEPNAVTMVSVIAACASLGASRPGRTLHKYVFTTGLDRDTRVTSALIDMYAKCGDLQLARNVFADTDDSRRSVVSWSSIIGAEGLHGEARCALHLFSTMQERGFLPNEVSFVSLLSACSHAGLVEEGLSCFHSMEKDHGVTPTEKHYACVVDLLGRAGHLEEAYNFIQGMPIQADVAVWGCLLGACRVHGNWQLGETIEKEILTLDPSSVGHHVLLANIYSEAGRLEDVLRMRVTVRRKGLRKIAGRSFIETGDEVYGFRAEDWLHSESQLIYEELRDIHERIKQAGWVEEEKEERHGVLSGRSQYHSERLAIAFGMMMMKRNKEHNNAIRVTKNLRVCRDCHVYTKLLSKVFNIELIVRDSHRFHHFKDGLCSCGDYW